MCDTPDTHCKIKHKNKPIVINYEKMNFSGNRVVTGDDKLSVVKAALNPNAAEFVPLALRSPTANIEKADASSKFVASATASNGKTTLDRSESSASNNSDDEAHQYWRHQLPDDITPDFKFMGLDDAQGIHNLPLSSLSLTDVDERSTYVSSPGASFVLKEQQGLSPHLVNGNGYSEKLRHSVSSFGEYPSPTSFQPSLAKPWDSQIGSSDHLRARGWQSYSENLRNSFPTDVSNEQLIVDNEAASPLEFLATQYPGFAVESLAEVYFANGSDLNLTIEMLTQLELQVDAGLNQNVDSMALSTPNLSALDFPALSAADGRNGLPNFAIEDIPSNISPYLSTEKRSTLSLRSSSSMPSSATDFASAVKKVAPQDSSIWKYERSGSSDLNIGSGRRSQILASSYNSGLGRGSHGDKLHSRGLPHGTPVWLETGAAVANMYSEMREEARDHARVRNAYFEQARQAYLIGNKALAKELSIKGQLHNMQMKAAHGKAQEAIYRQRNPEMHSSGRDRMIDLHGLHVNEAIHVLKRELTVLKTAARSSDQPFLVYICVGTGHHTRGSRTPARLPTAVQRYLLEEEGLDFSEPQPGLLRVVIF